jgi:hypothetical protein
MSKSRTTYILAGIFAIGLLALVALEHSGVPTDRQRLRRESRILPDLLDLPESSIRKVAIERGDERLVFERRGQAVGRWQMIEPVDAMAEPSTLETLVRNLKELRPSPDSGRITGAESSFGFDPPAATVLLWGDRPAARGGTNPPLAGLAIGKAAHGMRFVRAIGTSGIEVADAKLLTAVDLPGSDWRDRNVMRVVGFQVATVTVKRDGKTIRAERGPRGRWRLSEPIRAPANGAKVESLIAALSSLRVVDGAMGYAADNVHDFAPFGLESPTATVELTTIRPAEETLVLHVGKPVPDQSDQAYVRQGDQDDVVIVGAKALSEIPQTAAGLRGRQVADIDVASVSSIQIRTKTFTLELRRGATDWELTTPRHEKADTALVQAFLRKIESLEASVFLEPNKARQADLAAPTMTIKIWQSSPAGTGSSSETAEPAVDLRIGGHDPLVKTILAQLAGDNAILALPDNLLEVLPANDLAFRDHTVLRLNPAEIRKLIVKRGGRTDELVPEQAGAPHRWRVVQPAPAAADTRSVTQALSVLANLRAETLISDSGKPPRQYGLDHPLLEVIWETGTDHAERLKVGARVPRTLALYAELEEPAYVFTLRGDVLKPFDAEFRDHVVMTFPLTQAERIVLNWGWPKRTLALRHRTPPQKGQSEWVDEPGSDARGIDLSGTTALVKALSHLETIRFIQYSGDIPPFTGLTRPRLVIEVGLGPKAPPRVLKIGDSTPDGVVFAAEGSGSAGPVFILPAASWNALIQSGERFEPLPRDVFAPAR